MSYRITAIEKTNDRLLLSRRAVVFPVATLSGRRPSGIEEAYQLTSDVWLRWLTANWKRLPYSDATKRRLWRCSPDGAYTDPETAFACGYSRICPWCFMRRIVGEIHWSTQVAMADLDRLLTQSKAKETRLIWLRHSTANGNPLLDPAVTAQLIDQVVYRPYFDAVRKLGTTVLGTVRKWNFQYYTDGRPIIRLDKLVVVQGRLPQSFNRPTLAKSVDLWVGESNASLRQRTKTIMQIVGGYCGYPRSLISLSNGKRTCEWLTAMQQGPKAHMFKCSGVFHNRAKRRR